MNEITDRINVAIHNLKDGAASQKDYVIIRRYLESILFKSGLVYVLVDRSSSDEELQEHVKDIIQDFYTDKLVPQIDKFLNKKSTFLKRSFRNYLVDKIREKKEPQSRLFIKIKEKLEKLGYSPVRPESKIYAPDEWPLERRNKTHAQLDEILSLDLPTVPYKGYKPDSKKADEIIETNDLDTLIKLMFNKTGKPIDIKDLSRAISQRIEGFPHTPEFEEQEIMPSIVILEIRELFTKEILPELDRNELKCLYNLLVRQISPEEEAQEEGCSHQTIRNRRERIMEKIHDLLKKHNFSEEDQEIFVKIFTEEFEKAYDPSSKNK